MLTLIFGFWINLQTVNVLKDWSAGCLIYSNGHYSDIYIPYKKCDEVAKEINKNSKR